VITPDPAHITALLEYLPEDALNRLGWKRNKAIRGGWTVHDGNTTRWVATATYTNLAAICHEVSIWLRDEHGKIVSPTIRNIDGVRRWVLVHLAENGCAPRLDCADSEPAALVAACKEIGK
jgi:hypothetical protein